VVLAYAVDIESLLGVTSVIVSIVYILLAVAALKVRRIPGTSAGWRMPWWPVAPLAVIGTVGYALIGSGSRELLVTLALCVVATAYYLAYLRPRRDTRFVVAAFDHEEHA
jgi:amino acid transporter